MFKTDSLFEKIAYSTIKIETYNSSGETNVGTGLIFGYNKKNFINFYLVTAKHLVMNAFKGKLLFIQSNGKIPLKGKFVTISMSNFNRKWVHHPKEEIDISILPLNEILYRLHTKEIQIFFCMIDHNSIPSEEDLRENIDPVEDILFPGYPDNIYDSKNLIPILRKGVTATPVSLDFEGHSMFLIDASIFPGTSGSPVFLCKTKEGSKDKDRKNKTINFFLGIISNVFVKDDVIISEKVKLNTKTISTHQTRQFMDLGIVFKANLIKELIEEYQKAEFIIFLLDYVINRIKTYNI